MSTVSVANPWLRAHAESRPTLAERNQRYYYLLPLGWQHRTDPTYIVVDDDSMRIELFPGTQPPR